MDGMPISMDRVRTKRERSTDQIQRRFADMVVNDARGCVEVQTAGESQTERRCGQSAPATYGKSHSVIQSSQRCCGLPGYPRGRRRRHYRGRRCHSSLFTSDFFILVLPHVRRQSLVFRRSRCPRRPPFRRGTGGSENGWPGKRRRPLVNAGVRRERRPQYPNGQFPVTTNFTLFARAPRETPIAQRFTSTRGLRRSRHRRHSSGQRHRRRRRCRRHR